MYDEQTPMPATQEEYEIAATIRIMEVEKRVQDAISVLMDELNSSATRVVAKAVLDRVCREHRTLQQSFWNMMLNVQMNYADASFDLRNEQAVKLAQAVDKLALANNWDLGLPHY